MVVVERSGSIEDSKSSLDRFLGLMDDDDEEELEGVGRGPKPEEIRRSKMS